MQIQMLASCATQPHLHVEQMPDWSIWRQHDHTKNIRLWSEAATS